MCTSISKFSFPGCSELSSAMHQTEPTCFWRHARTSALFLEHQSGRKPRQWCQYLYKTVITKSVKDTHTCNLMQDIQATKRRKKLTVKYSVNTHPRICNFGSKYGVSAYPSFSSFLLDRIKHPPITMHWTSCPYDEAFHAGCDKYISPFHHNIHTNLKEDFSISLNQVIFLAEAVKKPTASSFKRCMV